MPATRILPGFISVEELATRLNVKPDAARKYVADPNSGLDVVKHGGVNHIEPSSIAVFIDKRRKWKRTAEPAGERVTA